jgi:hypothetical protein
MKKISLFLVSFILLLATNTSANNILVGKKYHITGCENGTLYVPVVHMWDKPCGGGCAKVIGKLSGDGREDLGLKCQGAVVEVLQKKGNWIKIKSVINHKEGWVQKVFIGRRAK